MLPIKGHSEGGYHLAFGCSQFPSEKNLITASLMMLAPRHMAYEILLSLCSGNIGDELPYAAVETPPVTTADTTTTTRMFSVCT